MKIILDPGHGGDQPGAVYGGVEEEDITLEVALHASNVLRGLGHSVVLTRDRDAGVTLTARVNMANEFKADLFISIHCNAAADDGKAHGVETYYRDQMDYPLADCIQKVFTTYAGMKDVGVLQDIARLHKRLTVLNDTNIPSALVEIGYLSNTADREYLTKNIVTAAELVAHGVDWFACLKEGKEKTAWPA